MDEETRESLSELRGSFRDGRTKCVAWRKRQLNAIIDLVRDNEDKIFHALLQDIGKHPVEAYRDELGMIYKSASHALSCIDQWTAPTKASLPLLIMPARAEVKPEPLGVVLVISSWNFPIYLSLDPLIGAIVAGNSVLLKPSESAPACSAFLAKTIPHYLDSKAVKVVEGGADVSNLLVHQQWDKIFFTGSRRVGRIVMSAAAKNLTPVVLELGGKCPAIFDSLTNSYYMKVAVDRVLGAKWGICGGQACIAIDYILVEQHFANTLVESLKTALKRFYGENPKNSKDICRCVNRLQFERLHNLIKDPLVAATIVHGGSVDKENLIIEPTILLNPPLDSEIMTEEIFGPLLPLITVKKIEEGIEFINAKPKPLAIYALTNNESFKQRLVQETSSGSLTFNDALVHVACDSLPFGGVGQSGFGRYHGKYSFDTFSHEKVVLRRSFLVELEARYPPWNAYKLNFIKLAYKFDYFGLVALLLGLEK